MAKNLAQATRLWVDVAPGEAAFFKRKIEQAAQEWKAMEAADEEPVAVNFATAKAKEETK
jgi:hypothetical protein